MDFIRQPDHAEAFPADARTARLLQRFHHPAALIDLRRAQGMHARISAWIGRHTSFLDRWNLRYGSPAPEVVWAGNGVTPTIAPSTPSSPATSDVRTDSGTRQFRVRHQAAQAQHNLVQSPSAHAVQGKKSTSASTIHSSAQTAATRAVSRRTIQRKTDRAVPGNTRINSSAIGSLLPPASQMSSPSGEAGRHKADAVTIHRHFSYPPMPLQLLPSPDSAVGEHRTNPVTIHRHGGEDIHDFAPAAFARTTESYAGGALSYPPMPLTGQVSLPVGDGGWHRADAITAHTHGGRNIHDFVPAALARTTLNISQTSLSAAAWPFPLASKAITIQRKPGIVSEAPKRAALAPVQMIWRKPEPTPIHAMTPIAGGPPAIQRVATNSASSVSSSSFVSPDATAASAKSGPGINVMQVAENVSRLLARQLVIERERRGRSL